MYNTENDIDDFVPEKHDVPSIFEEEEEPEEDEPDYFVYEDEGYLSDMAKNSMLFKASTNIHECQHIYDLTQVFYRGGSKERVNNFKERWARRNINKSNIQQEPQPEIKDINPYTEDSIYSKLYDYLKKHCQLMVYSRDGELKFSLCGGYKIYQNLEYIPFFIDKVSISKIKRFLLDALYLRNENVIMFFTIEYNKVAVVTYNQPNLYEPHTVFLKRYKINEII